MKNPICVRDLQGTHLINNLAPSSSLRNSLSHLGYCSFFFSSSRLSGVDGPGWPLEGISQCNFLFLSVCKCTPISHDDLFHLEYSLIRSLFQRDCEESAVLGSKLELIFPSSSSSSSSSTVWMRIAGPSSRPLTRQARCRASRRFPPTLWLILVTILSQRSLLASPKWSNLNKTVIQFRFIGSGIGKAFNLHFRMVWIE